MGWFNYSIHILTDARGGSGTCASGAEERGVAWGLFQSLRKDMYCVPVPADIGVLPSEPENILPFLVLLPLGVSLVELDELLVLEVRVTHWVLQRFTEEADPFRGLYLHATCSSSIVYEMYPRVT